MQNARESFFVRCFLLSCLALLFFDSQMSSHYGSLDIFRRFDEGRLVLPFFAWLPPPGPALYRILYGAVLLSVLSLCFRIEMRWSALIAAFGIAYLALSNIIFAYNFHFFTAFFLLFIFARRWIPGRFTSENFQSLARVTILAIYCAVVVHRITGDYFGGESVRLEVQRLMTAKWLANGIAGQEAYSAVAWATFLAELAVIWGLLRNSFWLGFVMPVAFHLALGSATILVVPNFIMIACLFGVLLPEHQEQIKKMGRSLYFLIGALVLIPVLFLVSSPLNIYTGGMLTFFAALIWISRHHTAIPAAATLCQWKLGYVGAMLFGLKLLYLSMNLWSDDLIAKSYAYAMYSGKVFSMKWDNFAIIEGIDLKESRFRRNGSTNVGHFPKLLNSEIDSQRQWLNIAKAHWYPRILDWLCAMPELRESPKLKAVTLYPGGAKPPDPASAFLSRRELPCLNSRL